MEGDGIHWRGSKTVPQALHWSRPEEGGVRCDPCSLGASPPLPASARGHQVWGRGTLEPWRVGVGPGTREGGGSSLWRGQGRQLEPRLP